LNLSNFKAKVAAEAIKSEDTIAELSSKFEVHRAQIMRWKKEALKALPEIFTGGQDRKKKDQAELIVNIRVSHLCVNLSVKL